MLIFSTRALGSVIIRDLFCRNEVRSRVFAVPLLRVRRDRQGTAPCRQEGKLINAHVDVGGCSIQLDVK
jgi:hypothetical protein